MLYFVRICTVFWGRLHVSPGQETYRWLIEIYAQDVSRGFTRGGALRSIIRAPLNRTFIRAPWPDPWESSPCLITPSRILQNPMRKVCGSFDQCYFPDMESFRKHREFLSTSQKQVAPPDLVPPFLPLLNQPLFRSCMMSSLTVGTRLLVEDCLIFVDVLKTLPLSTG